MLLPRSPFVAKQKVHTPLQDGNTPPIALRVSHHRQQVVACPSPTRNAPDSAFKIAIPAVKIAGDVDTHLDLVNNIESVCDDLLQVVPDICLVPDSCLSLMEKKTMPFPEAFPGLVPSASRSVSADAGMMAAAATDVLMSAAASDESVPGVSTDESGDDEEDDCNDLGEFLLDAVQWLL